MIELSRRRLFGFGAAFLAAPAIVRVASLMSVSVLPAVSPTLVAPILGTPTSGVLTNAARIFDSAKFRELLMPGLRDYFATYKDLNDEFDQVWRS